MRIQLKIKQTRFKSLERIFWYPILILYVLQKNKNLFREGRLGIWQLCLHELLSIEKLCTTLLIHKTQTESYHRRSKSTSQSSTPIINAPNIFVYFLLCFICFRWLRVNTAHCNVNRNQIDLTHQPINKLLFIIIFCHCWAHLKYKSSFIITRQSRFPGCPLY